MYLINVPRNIFIQQLREALENKTKHLGPSYSRPGHIRDAKSVRPAQIHAPPTRMTRNHAAGLDDFRKRDLPGATFEQLTSPLTRGGFRRLSSAIDDGRFSKSIDVGATFESKRAGSRQRAGRRGGHPGEAQLSQPAFTGPRRNGGRERMLAPVPVRKSFSRAPLPAPRGPDGTPQSRIRTVREQRADEKPEVRAGGILGSRELVVVAWCRAGRWRAAKPIRVALSTGSTAESLRDGRGRLPKRRPTRSRGPHPLRVNATQRRSNFRVVETEAAPPTARRGSIRAA